MIGRLRDRTAYGARPSVRAGVHLEYAEPHLLAMYEAFVQQTRAPFTLGPTAPRHEQGHGQQYR
ncbi:MAG: hypothetical protein ACK559_00625, partial [bacterium]